MRSASGAATIIAAPFYHRLDFGAAVLVAIRNGCIGPEEGVLGHVRRIATIVSLDWLRNTARRSAFGTSQIASPTTASGAPRRGQRGASRPAASICRTLSSHARRTRHRDGEAASRQKNLKLEAATLIGRPQISSGWHIALPAFLLGAALEHGSVAALPCPIGGAAVKLVSRHFRKLRPFQRPSAPSAEYASQARN